ncbi:hypothetical protein A1OW_00440 [Enterovibrio norvegicus]|uniref:TorD/DmsD family molecular chaperone n=1 Tax=Enterovibrio norvegicus TaxID=188144 RepID=UPI00031930F4|nr:molecular chaperone TorD family protein [Enterovibrio norvegicus]OEF60381.1 hypothetical protein A1OW_00440 [Enterovibrio norvegicus]
MAMQEMINVDDISNEENPLRHHIYSLLAHLLRQAPDESTLAWLATLETEGDEHSAGMAAAWSVLTLSAKTTRPVQAADEYQLLFIGVGRGEVMPFGSWYLTGSLMELPLVLLRQDLRQLGFERQEDTKEPEDHIAALLEVMGMLVEEGDETQQAAFFNRHVAPWFETLFTDIKRADAAVFYTAVAELAQQFLMIEKIRFTQRPW